MRWRWVSSEHRRSSCSSLCSFSVHTITWSIFCKIDTTDIAHLTHEWYLECLLWDQSLIAVQHSSLQCYMQYKVDRNISVIYPCKHAITCLNCARTRLMLPASAWFWPSKGMLWHAYWDIDAYHTSTTGGAAWLNIIYVYSYSRVGNCVPAWNVSLWLLWRFRCD